MGGLLPSGWVDRVFARLSRAASVVERFIVHGPDSVDVGERPGPLETLLPWPVRLLVTAGVWLISWIWYDSGPARQLSWALAYAGGIAVSLAASAWWLLFLLNAFLGGLWLLLTFTPPPDRETHPLIWRAQHIVEFANRQLSHIEALWIWMALVLSCIPKINYQLTGLVGLLLLGPAIINGLAAWYQPNASKARGELQVARRPFIYGATLLGLVLLVARSLDGQVGNLVPLAVAISLGAVLRLVRHGQRTRLVAEYQDPAAQANVRAFRRAQRRGTRGADVGLGPVLVVVSLLALVWVSLRGREHLGQVQREALDGPEPATDACAPEQGGPAKPEVTMFVVADTQFHHLGGERFPGQTELADALVAAALRPVELDMLSAAPVNAFGRMFGALGRRATGPVFWTHLGDFADLSCTDELDRALDALAPFGTDRLAGLAAGNHDTAFHGNFFWSPFWTSACEPAERLDKRASLARMKRFALEAGIESRGGAVAEVGSSSSPRWLGGRAGALVTVTPLGPIHDRGRARGLAAIFIDTTDGRGFDRGIAGLHGTFSDDQAEKLRALVRGLPARAGAAYQDPVFVLFSHHTVGEVAGANRERLNAFLTWLDDDPLGLRAPGAVRPALPHPRTLAVISAHTHHAEAHRHCIGGRALREIVVGSTIDPPQQAAVLEVGANARGVASVRLRTIPLVARPGLTCGDEPDALDAGACRRIIAGLKQSPSCEALFEESANPRPECGDLEVGMSFTEKVRALVNAQGVFEPADIRREQDGRARALMTCVCRKDERRAACQPIGDGKDPLAGEAYAGAIAGLLRGNDEDARRELACLSWAAAAVQGHKAAGMTFAQALRCAFDDPSLPAALEIVAGLEVHPCR